MFTRKRWVKELVRAYREVFDRDRPSVDEVLANLCSEHNVFNGGFDPDPYINAFQAGERNVVLRILTILNLTHVEIEELSRVANREEEQDV